MKPTEAATHLDDLFSSSVVSKTGEYFLKGAIDRKLLARVNKKGKVEHDDRCPCSESTLDVQVQCICDYEDALCCRDEKTDHFDHLLEAIV